MTTDTTTTKKQRTVNPQSEQITAIKRIETILKDLTLASKRRVFWFIQDTINEQAEREALIGIAKQTATQKPVANGALTGQA